MSDIEERRKRFLVDGECVTAISIEEPSDDFAIKRYPLTSPYAKGLYLSTTASDTMITPSDWLVTDANGKLSIATREAVETFLPDDPVAE